MSLNKQAKTLTSKQSDLVLNYLTTTRSPLRNKLIYLLSIKAGLRAKEIASLKCGRSIPINKSLKVVISDFLDHQKVQLLFDVDGYLISTQRSSSTTPQAIVNMFQGWYKELNLLGCSSHSGRRTFITNCSRKITTVGGSLRDVQYLAGHSSLQTTQRYIEGNSESKKKVVDLV